MLYQIVGAVQAALGPLAKLMPFLLKKAPNMTGVKFLKKYRITLLPFPIILYYPLTFYLHLLGP